MKTRLIFIILCFSTSIQAQEVISEVQEYVTYQDTLFTLKTTQVVSTGYEGINDTSITYSPPVNTDGLSIQLYTTYQNSIHQASARMRNAVPFRSVLATYVASKAILSTLGVDIDSVNVATYSNTLSGRWRVFLEDDTNFFVNIAPHPTLPGLLRATGENAEGNFNITVYGRHFFRFTVGAGDVRYLVWDGASTDKPLYQNPVRMTTPVAVSASNSFRMVKID